MASKAAGGVFGASIDDDGLDCEGQETAHSDDRNTGPQKQEFAELVGTMDEVVTRTLAGEHALTKAAMGVVRQDFDHPSPSTSSSTTSPTSPTIFTLSLLPHTLDVMAEQYDQTSVDSDFLAKMWWTKLSHPKMKRVSESFL